MTRSLIPSSCSCNIDQGLSGLCIIDCLPCIEAGNNVGHLRKAQTWTDVDGRRHLGSRHFAHIDIDGSVGDVDGQHRGGRVHNGLRPLVTFLDLIVFAGVLKRLQRRFAVRRSVGRVLNLVQVHGLDLRVEFHENWLDSVGDGIAGMINVVQEFAERPRQNVVVIFLIRGVSPTQRQKHGQRRAEAEEVFNPEEEAGLSARLRAGSSGSPSGSPSSRAGSVRAGR